MVARRRGHGRPGPLSEPARYRIAIQTGEVSGDVSRWPGWIRRDRKLTVVGTIFFVLVPVLFGAMSCFASMLGAEVHPFSLVPLFLIFAVLVWQQWRMRQRLETLADNLSARGAASLNGPS